MRKWVHVQKLRKKMVRPGENPTENESPRYGSTKKDQTPMDPRYRFVSEYTNGNRAEAAFHLRNVVGLMARATRFTLEKMGESKKEKKAFRVLLGQHMRVMKIMKTFVSLSKKEGTYSFFRGMTSKQIERKTIAFHDRHLKLQRAIYDIYVNPPKALTRLLGKENARVIWVQLRSTIFVPDFDSVYRWIESRRRY